MYLAYLDDSGTKQRNVKFQVLSAVIIKDIDFAPTEMLTGVVLGGADLLPPDKLEKFEEFHAYELVRGYGVFEGIDPEKRMGAVDALLSTLVAVDAKVVYGAVDRSRLSQHLYGSADPIDIAFRICICGITDWLDKHHNGELAIIIADETEDKKVKQTLSTSFRQLRPHGRPPDFDCGNMANIHDSMYFGNSKDSIGIQLADLSSYLIARHLEQDSSTEGFYNRLQDQIVHSKVEPE